MTNPDKNCRWYRRGWKAKDPTISDMIQSRREEGRPYIAGDLRADLVQREMARHNFTRKQALAGILAFSRESDSHE